MQTKKRIELSPTEMKEISAARSWEDPTTVNCPLGDTVTCPEGYVSDGTIELMGAADIGLYCKPADEYWPSLDSGTIDDSGTGSSGTGGSGTEGSGTEGSDIIEVYCKGCSKLHKFKKPSDFNNSKTACDGLPMGSVCYFKFAGALQLGKCKLSLGVLKCDPIN